MAITSYSELQTAITSNWPNRTDLATIAPDLITIAEARLNRDKRVRSVISRDIVVTADDYELPSDFKSLVSLYHDGSTYYGGIRIVSPGRVAALKTEVGKTGAPQYAAILDTEAPFLRFAPAPDTSYTLKLTYDSKLVSLSDTDTTNWLLRDHPDIYLFASLIEVEGYILEDERIPLWEAKLERALADLSVYTQRLEYGGQMVARPAGKAFGG